MLGDEAFNGISGTGCARSGRGIAIVDAGGHAVARVGEGISLPIAADGGWLPDGPG
jgi:hypothetical protein